MHVSYLALDVRFSLAKTVHIMGLFLPNSAFLLLRVRCDRRWLLLAFLSLQRHGHEYIHLCPGLRSGLVSATLELTSHWHRLRPGADAGNGGETEAGIG